LFPHLCEIPINFKMELGCITHAVCCTLKPICVFFVTKDYLPTQNGHSFRCGGTAKPSYSRFTCSICFLTCMISNSKVYEAVSCSNKCFFQVDALLAHLSWKLKWTILIAVVRRLSVRPSVRPSVSPSVCKLLHFRLLLQNYWANLTRLGTNHPWGKGIQVCSNEGDLRSLRGDNSERVTKNRIKKNLLLQNHKA
jgi:hypothetical protein